MKVTSILDLWRTGYWLSGGGGPDDYNAVGRIAGLGFYAGTAEISDTHSQSGITERSAPTA